jgi:esterase/lipase superfamily enzyme
LWNEVQQLAPLILFVYPIDESNIEWTEADLQRFLADFANQSDATNIYLIAHSMGSRATSRALAALAAQQPAVRSRFRELILAAPDIDADVFKRDIAPVIVSSNSLITIYASSTDKALVASKAFHGYPRLGDAGSGLVILPGVDTIDASAVDTSFLGHSYFADNRSVLSDMFYLMRDGTPLNQNTRVGLTLVGIPPAQYWEFKR